MVGEVLGRYRIVERIGIGGMGVVYRARDERLDRDVALKVLPDGTLASDAARRRFRREALALSRLSHPNIASVHDFDTQENVDFIVMEFIPGAPLSECCARGPLPERDVARLGLQLAEGLAAAHAQGVVHRDLKPANVRVTPDGRLKILDFGVARLLGGDVDTHTGTDGVRPPGTLPYMAPEQIRGEPADARADIFAAGAVLFEMATGRRAFAATMEGALVNSILNDPTPSPAATNRRLSPALDAVVVKALDKAPDRRYQSAAELAVDLARVASPTATTGRVGRGPRRANRRIRWLAAAALAAVAAVTAWAVFFRMPPPPPFQERDHVLIADFDNQSGDPGYDLAVREGLLIVLEQSRYVNVVSRTQAFDALRRMQRADTTRIDEGLGREICLRENIPILLAGTIRKSGATIQIVVRATQPATGDQVFFENVQFDRPEDVFDRVDTLARRVRRRLGESERRIEESSEPLARVTTPSFRALQQYSAALIAQASGDMADAADRLRAALAADPDFAMAHLRLGRYYATVQGKGDLALDHFTRAYELRSAVSPREAYMIEAGYYKALHQSAKVVDSLRAFTELYPDDAEVRSELVGVLRDVGDLRGAVTELREVVRLDPHNEIAWGNLVVYLARSNQNAEAVSVYETARTENLSSPYLCWGAGLARLGLDLNVDARADFQSLADTEGPGQSLGRLFLAQADTYEGRLDQAARRLEDGIRLDRSTGNVTYEVIGHYLLARVALLRGQAPLARRHADAIAGAGETELQGRNLYRLGSLYSALGATAEARAVRARLARLAEANATAFNQSSLATLDGELALAGGNARAAAEAFRSAAVYPLRYEADQGLALALEQRGEWAAAAEAWRRALDAKGSILQVGFAGDWVLAHLGLARALRAAGDQAGADAAYERFRTLWPKAGELPALADAIREAAGDPPDR